MSWEIWALVTLDGLCAAIAVWGFSGDRRKWRYQGKHRARRDV